MSTKRTVLYIIALGLVGLLLLAAIYLISLQFQPHRIRNTEVRMQRKFQTAFHIPGTLAADLNIRWTVPSDCQLIHVSAVASDANAAGLEVGTSADTDGYITKYSIGVSNTPVQKEAITDFDGALAGSQYPHIVDGTIMVLVLDFNYNDGGGAAASDDVTIVLTFLEG
jgi:hypothetical protein